MEVLRDGFSISLRLERVMRTRASRLGVYSAVVIALGGVVILSKLARLPQRIWDRTGGAAISSFRPGSFVVLHQHRCGSTVLGHMLGSHPKITARGEIVTYHMLTYEEEHGTTDGWTCDPADIVRRRRRENPWGWFGCEFTTRNAGKLGVSLDEMIAMLRELGFTRFIVLERRNHLRRYISSRSGWVRGTMHVNKGAAVEKVTVSLDPQCTGMYRDSAPLLDMLRSDTAEITRLLELTAPFDPLHLVYEDDLLADPTVGYAKACDFLGVAPVAMEPRTVRTSPFPIAQMLENYDEIASVLRGTQYAWMLDE